VGSRENCDQRAQTTLSRRVVNKWKVEIIPGLYHGRDKGSKKCLKEMGVGEDTVFSN